MGRLKLAVICAATMVASAMTPQLSSSTARVAPIPVLTSAVPPAPGAPEPAGIAGPAASGTFKDGSDCATVVKNLAAYRGRGQSRVTCLKKVVVKHSPPSNGAAVLTAAYLNPQAECATNNEVQTWYYGREWFCFIDEEAWADTYNTSTGEVLGYAGYTINHAVGLDPRSGTWSNYTSFYIQPGTEWGDYPNIVFSTNGCGACTGTATAYPFGSPQTLTPGVAVGGSDNLSDNPGYNQVDGGITVWWNDSIKSADASNSAVIEYTSPLSVRCDGQPNTGATQGCALPSYTPELQITGYGSGNTSAAFVYYFQYYNVDHWGEYPNGTPLTRLNNDSQATANRTAMCYSGAWTANPLVSNDSCDEFPFARTYQSGNMLGISASNCSQILPEWNSLTSSWTFVTYPGYSTSQRCGLGHVQYSDNTSVGGMYGSFIQNNRVIDSDPFWLGVFN